MSSSAFAFHDSIRTTRAWDLLPEADKEIYTTLRTAFQSTTKSTSREQKKIQFKSEIRSILDFIESSDRDREDRSIVSGIAFTGPFICVNTRQLKNLIGKCKSSINGCFQQLGYVAVKTKPKARTVVLSILPSLHGDPGAQRQWTVRYHPGDPLFISKYTSDEYPEMTDEDLYEDKRTTPDSPTDGEKPLIEFDSSYIVDAESDFRAHNTAPAKEVKSSASLDILSDIGDTWDCCDDYVTPLVRSKSHAFGYDDSCEWLFL